VALHDPTSRNVVGLALNVSRDGEAISCLTPHLASCLEAQYSSEWDTIRYELTQVIDVKDLITGRKAIMELCQPADRKLVGQCLVKLRALTATRNLGDFDLDLTLEAYADKLMEYPADAVVQALNEAPDRDKWFPAWADLKTRLDYHTTDRRLVVQCLDRKIAKLQPKTSVQGLIKGAVKK